MTANIKANPTTSTTIIAELSPWSVVVLVSSSAAAEFSCFPGSSLSVFLLLSPWNSLFWLKSPMYCPEKERNEIFCRQSCTSSQGAGSHLPVFQLADLYKWEGADISASPVGFNRSQRIDPSTRTASLENSCLSKFNQTAAGRLPIGQIYSMTNTFVRLPNFPERRIVWGKLPWLVIIHVGSKDSCGNC